MFDVSIKAAEKSDLQQILDLQYLAYRSEAELFNDKNIPPLTQTLIDLQNEYAAGIILKAVKDNEIIGSVRGRIELDTTHIGKLIVHPKYQGRGLGTKLLSEIERYCSTKRYELFTSTKSFKNIRLYERLGYKKFREKKLTDELKFVYLEKIKYHKKICPREFCGGFFIMRSKSRRFP